MALSPLERVQCRADDDAAAAAAAAAGKQD